MSTEVEVDASVLENLEFETCCDMVWYRNGEPLPPCGDTAEFTCSYWSCCLQEWKKSTICFPCLEKVKQHDLRCYRQQCQGWKMEVIKDILPLRGK